MYSFACDYLEGCHEEVLKALCQTNLEQTPGYGADRFTKAATEKIRQLCRDDAAAVYFVNGGTQANQLVIDTMLQPYEGVVAAPSARHDGKLAAADADAFVKAFYADPNHEHMVFPGMVYISHPTEYGTLYTAQELRELSAVCRRHHMSLYLDGARLVYGLAAYGTDVTLSLLDELCDVFYIGGTKAGALNGEAIVFPRGAEPPHFLTRIKQHGALSAKGRLIGTQFAALLENDLYFRIGRHAIDMAREIRKIFQDAGCRFYLDSPTNQQFVILENESLRKLSAWVGFEFWEPYDAAHAVVRFASSWATTPAGIAELRKAVALCLPRK